MYLQVYHGVPIGAQNGEANGISILFDVEQYNYAYYRANGAGLRMSIHDHRDKPIIGFGSILIHSGTETQLALSPTVTYATEDALNTFSPDERNCYTDTEKNLTYQTYTGGFRYEMKTCLIDNAIRDIVWECRCLPSFHDFCPGKKSKSLFKKWS